MLIVSQDRKWIVNMDNCFDIFAGEMNEIIAMDGKRCITLGVYSSEEKAKEVLRRIAESYSVQESTKIALISGNEKNANECARARFETYGNEILKIQTKAGVYMMPTDEEER